MWWVKFYKYIYTKMTNYDKIYKLLEANKIAEVKLEDWNYILFSSIISDWGLRCSSRSCNIKYCYDQLGIRCYDKYSINDLSIISIKEYDKAPYIYKAWDMVNISEHVKNIPKYNNYCKVHKEMIWWPFEIKKICFNWSYLIYAKDKFAYTNFDSQYLSPYIEPIWPSEE